MGYSLENPLDYSGDDGKPLVALFAAEADHDAAISDEPTVSVRRDAVAQIRKAAEPPCSVGPSTAYLAVTYLDRFLTKRVTQVKKPWFSVFLSLTCLSLASKMLDHGFSVDEFQLLVLESLGWRLRSITPFAFLDCFLSSFPSTDPRQVQDLKDRASKTLFQAQTGNDRSRPSFLKHRGFDRVLKLQSFLDRGDAFRVQAVGDRGVRAVLRRLRPVARPIHRLRKIRVCREIMRKVNTNRCDLAAAKKVVSGSDTPLAAIEPGGEGDTIRGSGSDALSMDTHMTPPKSDRQGRPPAIEPSSPRFFLSAAAAASPGSHRRIAIAVDLSDESAYAVKWAVQNYLRPGDAVILLHVRSTSILYGADWGAIDLSVSADPDSELSQQKLEEDFDAFTSTKAQDLAQPLVEAQIPFKIHIVKDHDMKERLCLEVERLGLSAVIMGSRGFGASRRSNKSRLGSVSDYCVHHCVCPVVVVRFPDDGTGVGLGPGGSSAPLDNGSALPLEKDVELHPVLEEEQEYHDATDEHKESSDDGGSGRNRRRRRKREKAHARVGSWDCV
ncbi:hypothetical protein BHE74_00020309 [Ensete ventricosum]|nr:hypothetical protein BHE74_00020309 [Ensete ventricosum]